MDLTVFQMLVRRWVVRAFGEAVADDKAERTHRFLKEALELAQATDCTQEQAHALVEYVYGREVGKPGQEVGGTMLTLAALCAARNISMNVEAAAEITRVNKPEMLEKIRRKQEAKKRDIPLGSPLPGSVGVPLDTRSLIDGRTLGEHLNESHCEICAPQEKRVQGVRCDLHVNTYIVAADVPPLREQPGGGKLPRTHTDAVGTDGGKATVAHKI